MTIFNMSSTLTQPPESAAFVPDPARPVAAVAHDHAAAAEQITRIEPGRGFRLKDLADLWRYRELLYFLAWRDIAIRYKQTVLGVGWAFLQPLATMLVFAVFLGRLGKLNAGIEHYSLFVFAGVLPWTFFANAVTSAGFSIVLNERLITKIYFPRLLVPLAAIGAPLFDLGISAFLLAGMMAWFGVAPGLSILALPFLLLMLFAAAVGVGCFLAPDRRPARFQVCAELRRAALDVRHAEHLPQHGQPGPDRRALAAAQPCSRPDPQPPAVAPRRSA